MIINQEAQKSAQKMPASAEFLAFYPNPNIGNNQEIIAPKEPSLSRQEILSEYSNKFKTSKQFQFRNSFTSAGSFQPTNNLPTITYIGSIYKKLREIH